MSTKYIPCSESDIPAGVRFDVPGRLQGQPTEVAYGGFSRGEHDEGDPYKRVTERAIGPTAVRYYKLATGGLMPPQWLTSRDARLEIRLPQAVLDAIDRAAARAGLTRTDFVLSAVDAALPADLHPDARMGSGPIDE